MPIQLADLVLERVHRISTSERAAFVHHRVPGAEGDVIQDLGRASVELRLEGICYGPRADDDLQKLRALHLAREPVDLIAEIVGQTYVSRVVLTRLEVTETADEPEQFGYVLSVSEVFEPPQPGADVAAVEANIELEAAALLDLATLPDALALGSLPDITDPFVPLRGALDPVMEASQTLHESMAGLKILLATSTS